MATRALRAVNDKPPIVISSALEALTDLRETVRRACGLESDHKITIIFGERSAQAVEVKFSVAGMEAATLATARMGKIQGCTSATIGGLGILNREVTGLFAA